MERQREIDFDNFEDFYDFFVRCIESIKGPDGKGIQRKEIAFRLGLTPSRISQRLFPTSENSPRFGLNDLVLYMVTFDDWRPLDYLHWFKKQNNGKKPKVNEREIPRIDSLVTNSEI